MPTPLRTSAAKNAMPGYVTSDDGMTDIQRHIQQFEALGDHDGIVTNRECYRTLRKGAKLSRVGSALGTAGGVAFRGFMQSRSIFKYDAREPSRVHVSADSLLYGSDGNLDPDKMVLFIAGTNNHCNDKITLSAIREFISKHDVKHGRSLLLTYKLAAQAIRGSDTSFDAKSTELYITRKELVQWAQGFKMEEILRAHGVIDEYGDT